ncbi:hypothetical protein [Streptomyces sp. RFCAC02]|uniref:hypothetical protein n=1 Tax=Streptomyces sp. RFCAC02 TaxID=2499143 RepID=UPI00101F1BA6|nr:hypothetical protein [Streptomyces sp. RFCAC02]
MLGRVHRLLSGVRAAPGEARRRFDLLGPGADTCGVIDWGAAGEGALLYDVATAVMDTDGRAGAVALLRHYVAEGALPQDEADRALGPLLDFRHAIGLVYYAGRVLRGDMRGLGDGSSNDERVEAARATLIPLS